MDSKLLSGTLEMLILEVIGRGDNYGYQISQLVLSGSGGCFDLKEGSLYPALHRLERRGLVSSYWVTTDDGRRRKYYRIAPAGRRAMKANRDSWTRFAAGVDGVLGQRHAIT